MSCLVTSLSALLCFVPAIVAAGAPAADTPAAGKSRTLIFREDWRETPAAIPVSQEHVGNKRLRLRRHGPGADLIKKSHHVEIPGDPFYVWSGMCDKRWAVTLEKKNTLVDLTQGKIRLRTRQSGNNRLYLVLGLTDDTWLVSQRGIAATPDWHRPTVDLAKQKWRTLDIKKIVAGKPVSSPNLAAVRHIGWTDLSVGRGSGSSTRVDWIEVHGQAH